jgi:hypothetical protein
MKLKQTDMTTQETYNLANEMTEQQVLNVLAGWENTNETKSIKTYKSLVILGDSMQLACATVIAEKVNNKETSKIYRVSYGS